MLADDSQINILKKL